MSLGSAERGAPRRGQHGLDGFAFFMADIQTGWGPFVAAYLTAVAWTQFDIGLILTIGTLAALVLQIPAGAVDRVPAKRLLAAIAAQQAEPASRHARSVLRPPVSR